MELRQDVTECKTYIVNHRQDIRNINTRHIPLNIQSKLYCLLRLISITCRGRRGRDRMVVVNLLVFFSFCCH
jgi:hypothetical protein